MQGLPQRFDGALALSAAGGLALLVSLFLDWYEPGLSAIEVFEITDLLLAGIAIASIAIAIQAMTVEPGYEDPRTDWLAPIGMAATAIVLWEIIDNPPAVAGNPVAAGAWIGFVGAIAIAVGALLWGSRLSLVLTLRPREGGEEEREAPLPAPVAEPHPDDPATGEEDVAGVEPYEPDVSRPREKPVPAPADETEIEPRTAQQPLSGGGESEPPAGR
ncbi:hypothetical protein HJD18_14390 [Thermoleophilia bacterium SCSIO 60948]|nr:hypothetical protein HJD18_14390 [Thermoleophilia bacterium SCSIO 60948]